MSDDKNINKKIDQFENAVKQYASKDTVISIGGYEFTPAKLMVAATIVSSMLGGLYGAFEVYKDYQGMKKKIADYITPDMSGFDKRLAIVETNSQKVLGVIEENSQKTTDYTRDIKNDLKNDIRRLEKIVEDVERNSKQNHKDTEKDVREIRRELDDKIKKALDNPLNK